MKRTAILALAMILSLPAAAAHSAPPPPLEPLSFLLGDWDAPGPNQSTGHTSFASRLQDQVIVRTNTADYPPAEGRPASHHEDLMVIYSVGRIVRADYYDSEGHAIRYRVLSPEAGKALFVSDQVENEPRYRIIYLLKPDGTLDGSFEIAPPGQPEAFKPYLTWQSRRAAPSGH